MSCQECVAWQTSLHIADKGLENGPLFGRGGGKQAEGRVLHADFEQTTCEFLLLNRQLGVAGNLGV